MQDGNNQTHWLDPCRRVCRQIRPGVSGGVAGGGGNGSEGGGGGLATCPTPLYLGVKFYASEPTEVQASTKELFGFLFIGSNNLQLGVACSRHFHSWNSYTCSIGQTTHIGQKHRLTTNILVKMLITGCFLRWTILSPSHGGNGGQVFA